MGKLVKEIESKEIKTGKGGKSKEEVKPKGVNRKETGAETPHRSKKGGGHFSKKKISTSSTLESKREFLSKNFKVLSDCRISEFLNVNCKQLIVFHRKQTLQDKPPANGMSRYRSVLGRRIGLGEYLDVIGWVILGGSEPMRDRETARTRGPPS